MKNSFLKIIIFLSLTIFIQTKVVLAVTGSIDSVSHSALVCHDVTCVTPTPGSINFNPTTGDVVTVDSVTGLFGQIWGNELGWIDLHPTGAGVTFSNPTTGVLTGKAWSQMSGWINFAPTGQQVTINPTTGQFSGWAWTGGPLGGWIKFDCGSVSSCVKTSTWLSSSGGGGGGGGGGQLIDVCPNIPLWQGSIPSGYTVNSQGSCIQIIDMCPNINGDQTEVPNNYVIDDIGACIPKAIDYCPNIKGTQNKVPNGYNISSAGKCVKAVVDDVCPDTMGLQTSTDECVKKDECYNLPGIQESTPTGYKNIENSCMPINTDLCPNLDEDQFVIPKGYILDGKGDCTPEALDLCPNISGSQDVVPQGFYLKNDLCLFGSEPKVQTSEKEEVKTVAFSFIPESVQIKSDDPILKAIVKKLGIKTTDKFHVDAVSAATGSVFSIIFLYILIRLFRMLFRRG